MSYLRSHPKVDQVSCNTSNFCLDSVTKAKAAGIKVGDGHVGLTYGSLGDAQLPQVADGTAASGQATPFEYVGWQLIDAMARHTVGDSLEPNWRVALPEYLRTPDNTKSGSKPYDGPTGFRAQFTAL